MKLMSKILIVLSTVSLCRAQCDSPTNQTGPMFTNIQDGIDLLSKCDFPNKKFNASCVSASCLPLATSGLCPYTSNGNLNLTALTSILSILNDCFKQKTTICDTPLANIPIPSLGVGLGQVFPKLPVGGQCSEAPNTGFINNVQNVSFAIATNQTSTSGPLNIIINAPATTLKGVIQCAITTSGATTFHLPNINYSMAITMTPTAAIDFSKPQPDVSVRTNHVALNFQVGNFVANSSGSSQLPAGLQQLFTNGITAVWTNSSLPGTIANFYAAYVASGLEASKRNCPS